MLRRVDGVQIYKYFLCGEGGKCHTHMKNLKNASELTACGLVAYGYPGNW